MVKEHGCFLARSVGTYVMYVVAWIVWPQQHHGQRQRCLDLDRVTAMATGNHSGGGVKLGLLTNCTGNVARKVPDGVIL